MGSSPGWGGNYFTFLTECPHYIARPLCTGVQLHTMHRGAICQFLFRWIYCCHSIINFGGQAKKTSSKNHYGRPKTVSSVLKSKSLLFPTVRVGLFMLCWQKGRQMLLLAKLPECSNSPAFHVCLYVTIFCLCLVFCHQNCSDLSYCEKKMFYWLRNLLKKFAKFEITRTTYSSNERSEQFLVIECFFNLFLDVSHVS